MPKKPDKLQKYQLPNDRALKVLILEDLSSDAELMMLQFDQLDLDVNFKITQAKEDYLQLLEHFRPDLILSDFNLPNFNGLSALKILRATDLVTPFLFVTGALGEENAVKAIKGGATDFIIKSNINQLPAAITRALRERKETKRREEMSKQFHESERRFRTLVQKGSELIAISDPEGVYTFVSDNYERILGYRKDELLGSSAFDFVHPVDLKRVRETFLKIDSVGTLQIEPFRFISKRGIYKWFRSSITSLANDPAINGIVVNSQDVTSLVLKEQELLNSNRRYELIVRSSEDLIYDWNLRTKQFFIDDVVVKRLFGHEFEPDSSHELWMQNIHPEDSKRVKDHLLENLTDRQIDFHSSEYRYVCGDGSYSYLHDVGHILRDNYGKAIRVVGVVRDITGQKTREIQKDIITEILKEFSKSNSLEVCLSRALGYLVEYLRVEIGEVWMPSQQKGDLKRVAFFCEKSTLDRYVEESLIRVDKHSGLPGMVWEKGEPITWSLVGNKEFVRQNLVQDLGLISALGMPITFGDELIAEFLFLSRHLKDLNKWQKSFLQDVCRQIGPELQRKYLEGELRSFFELSPDLLGILGVDGFFKKINPAFTNSLGYTETEIKSRSITSMMLKEDESNLKHLMIQLEQGEVITNFDLRVIHKDGSLRWLSWSANLMPDEGLIISAAKDVTEHKKLLELIHQSHYLAKIGSWEVDVVKDRVYWSPTTKMIHEVDKDFTPDVVKAIDFYKNQSDKDLITHSLQEAMKKGTPWDVECQILTGKGNTKWVRAIGDVEFIDGQCVRIFGSFQDISEQKDREQKIAESNQRFELAANASHEAIYEWVCATDDMIWSDGYLRLFGFEETNSKRAFFLQKIHHLEVDRVFRSLDRAMSDKEVAFWSEEYRLEKADGSTCMVEERGFIVRNEEGMPERMIGSLADITEEQAFREQLLENTIRSEEEERNRIAKDLHDGIVQELVAMSMRLDYLIGKDFSMEVLKQKLREITDLTRKITRDTRDISHNLMPLEIDSFTMSELLTLMKNNLNSLDLVEFEAQYYLEIEDLESDVKLNIYRILQELTNNIIKHSEAKKASISVRDVESTFIVITVQDNGKGMDSQMMTNGIGLMTVQNRINKLGGQLHTIQMEKGGLMTKIRIPYDFEQVPVLKK